MAAFEELLLEVDGSTSAAVASTELAGLDLKERDHLQEWVLRHPQVLGDGVRVITCEYDGWQAAGGELVRDRLDVLGLAPDGRPVVAELKRGMAPHSIHMQAINYAAMVSRLSTRDLAELCAQYEQRRNGVAVNVDDLLAQFQTNFLLNEESIRNPRLALIAADFPASVTASVVWLNERAVDVWLVRYRAYRLASGQVIVSFSRLFPVPTAEEFTVGRLRSPDATATESTPSVPWDEGSLKRLADRANAATLALLELTSSSDEPVGVAEIQAHASLTYGQVRGQLAGFTMLLRNKRNGFKQSAWPVQIRWLPGGVASYVMAPDVRDMWNAVRNKELSAVLPVQPAPRDLDGGENLAVARGSGSALSSDDADVG